MADLRKFLDELYNHAPAASPNNSIDLKFSDDELLEMAGNLSEGVPLATPVFDGAKEERSAAC